VKINLKGRFKISMATSRTLTAQLNSVPWDAFSDCFVQLLVKFKKCVAVTGDYFGARGE
jgi:hypothetical protein